MTTDAAMMSSQVMLGYQLYNVMVAFYVGGDLAAPAMIGHHFFTATLGALGCGTYRAPFCHYYCFFFFGLAEVRHRAPGRGDAVPCQSTTTASSSSSSASPRSHRRHATSPVVARRARRVRVLLRRSRRHVSHVSSHHERGARYDDDDDDNDDDNDDDDEDRDGRCVDDDERDDETALTPPRPAGPRSERSEGGRRKRESAATSRRARASMTRLVPPCHTRATAVRLAHDRDRAGGGCDGCDDSFDE